MWNFVCRSVCISFIGMIPFFSINALDSLESLVKESIAYEQSLQDPAVEDCDFQRLLLVTTTNEYAQRNVEVASAMNQNCQLGLTTNRKYAVPSSFFVDNDSGRIPLFFPVIYKGESAQKRTRDGRLFREFPVANDHPEFEIYGKGTPGAVGQVQNDMVLVHRLDAFRGNVTLHPMYAKRDDLLILID